MNVTTPTPWIPEIRKRRSLYLYRDAKTFSSPWNKVYHYCIQECNSVFQRYRLDITLITSSDRPTENGGADIWIKSIDGRTDITFGGNNVGATLNGSRLQGRTSHSFLLTKNNQLEIEKAFIYLPKEPLLSAPAGRRPVGQGVMACIFIHEIVHACGLFNNHHTDKAKIQDLMMENPDYYPGDTPKGDKLIAGGKKMPPIYISPSILSKLNSVW